MYVHHRGVSTAIGALLFLLIAFSMLGLYLMMYNLNSEIALTYLKKIEEESKKPNINFTVHYKRRESITPNLGTTIAYTVFLGEVNDDGVDSLVAIDDKKVMLTSTTGQGSSSNGGIRNIIRNGNFNNRELTPWIVYPQNYWDARNQYARYNRLVYFWPGGVKDYNGFLAQSFNYNSSFRNPILSFWYRYTIVSSSFLRRYSVNVTCFVQILDSRNNIIWNNKIVSVVLNNNNPTSSNSWMNKIFNLQLVDFNDGTYNLKFLIVIARLSGSFVSVNVDFGFDNICLNVTIPRLTSNFYNNFADIVFDIVDNSFTYFYFVSNTTTFLEIYHYDSSSNVWLLDKKYIIGDEYVNISIAYNRTRFFFYSYTPFQIDFNYVRINHEVLASKINISLSNMGNGEEHIIAVWINYTRYPNEGTLDFYVLPGENRTLTVDLASLGLSLENNKVYVIEIIGVRSKYIKNIET